MRKILAIIFALSTMANAQVRTTNERSLVFLDNDDNTSHRSELTGVLSHDLMAQVSDSIYSDTTSQVKTRSALTAGFFSLVVPGAGQAYNGNYMKAAGFFAVEVAGWVVNAMWNTKGNNQTTFFQNYADGSSGSNYANGHYSVLRYAQWIVDNYQSFINTGIPIGGGQYSPVLDPTTVNNYVKKIIVKSGSAGPPWDEINWAALNRVEAALGGYFSHILPAHGEQQYYELIGKYPQFREGWYDENSSFTSYDSLRTDTPNSGYYMNQRGKANNLYAVALTAVNVVIVNHFVSAIEAALWAHTHKVVEPTVGIAPLPDGTGYQTEVRLAIHF